MHNYNAATAPMPAKYVRQSEKSRNFAKTEVLTKAQIHKAHNTVGNQTKELQVRTTNQRAGDRAAHQGRPLALTLKHATRELIDYKQCTFYEMV